jgi:hypothetical protein
MKRIAILLALSTAALAQQPSAPEPVQRMNVPLKPKLYIDPRVHTVTTGTATGGPIAAIGTATTRERNVTAEVTANVVKHCSNAVTITGSPEAADFRLTLSPGSSVLYNRDGDVVTTFKAHRVGTVGKDICEYFGGKESKK